MELKKLKVDEIQKILLDIMINFDKLCEKLNIKYYLAFGTLLGAVRHKGFIPWDDDVDVFMHRDDYNVLLNYLNNNPGKYNIIHENSEFYRLGKFCDTSIDIMEWDVKSNPWIDIFLINGCPKNHIKKNIKKLYNLKKCRSLTKENLNSPNLINTPKFVKIIKKINKIIPFSVMFNKEKIDKKMLNILTYYDKNKIKTDYYIIYDTKILYYKKELFDKSIYTDFENQQFMIPIGYHEILKEYFGDYMTLPPENDRKMIHNIYLIEK